MSNEKPPADLIKVYFIKNCLPLNVTFLILRFLCIDMNVVCWLFCFLFQQMTQHDINFVAEFLRDNFNHFTLVRIMWSFVNGSDDFMCLIHVKGICKSKTFLCNFCVNGDMFIILWFTEICYLQYKQYVNCENIWNPFPFLHSVEKEIF